MPRILRIVLFCAAALLLCACGVDRNLKVTEVQPNAVELYLDETFTNQLDLTNMTFTWVAAQPTAQPTTASVDLSLVGSLQGGQFLMIYEDHNYHGPPVADPFPGPTPGIRVKNGFFPGYSHTPSVSMSVYGDHYRTYVLFVPVYKDQVRDTVRFGPTPRPSLPGTYYDTGTLASQKPQGNQSISRRWSSTNGTIDTDSENDWSLQQASPAAPNLP